jgi:uncharacterized protein (DUF362 family)
MTTRRDFLKTSLLLAPIGCAGVPVVDPQDAHRDRVVLGLFPSADLKAPEDAVHKTLEHVDMDWLRPGDSVFVKVASNSANVHPATTSPTAVRAMCKALFDRGAGRVVVGDQCGVMSSRLVGPKEGEESKGDRRWRSTKGVMEGNGLMQAIVDGGGEPHFFDERGFEEGYFKATLPVGNSWRRAPHIPRIVNEVDHIVYLPRLSSHVLCGYTHGHKIAVGWMRDDTRHEMHSDAGNIYEKYTELNYCEEIGSRLRLVVTLAEEVLCDGGPDGGSIATADPRIVLASTHLANHDAVSVGLLTWAQKNLARARNTGGVPYGAWATASNTAFLGIVELQTGIPWTSEGAALPLTYWAHDYAGGIDSDRALSRAYELLGGVPRSIEVTLTGKEPEPALREHLEKLLPVQL